MGILKRRARYLVIGSRIPTRYWGMAVLAAAELERADAGLCAYPRIPFGTRGMVVLTPAPRNAWMPRAEPCTIFGGSDEVAALSASPRCRRQSPVLLSSAGSQDLGRAPSAAAASHPPQRARRARAQLRGKTDAIFRGRHASLTCRVDASMALTTAPTETRQRERNVKTILGRR